MRISDWSSDVCSSDLQPPAGPWHDSQPTPSSAGTARAVPAVLWQPRHICALAGSPMPRLRAMNWLRLLFRTAQARLCAPPGVEGSCQRINSSWRTTVPSPSIRPWQVRSEEHTSELQSLMRTSYAVFCLNNKTTYQKSKQTAEV